MPIIDYTNDYLEIDDDQPCTRYCEYCQCMVDIGEFDNAISEDGICDHCFDDMKKALGKFLGKSADDMTDRQKELAAAYIEYLESLT